MAGVPLPGVDLIKTFEGSRLEAYPDPKTGGEPITIGWGSTRDRNGRPFKLGDRITAQEAEELLMGQITGAYLPPQERIPGWQNLNDNQRGAILSFAYNLGARFYGANGFETISRVLRNQEWHNIEPALILYRNPGTRVEEGLLRRRLAEANVFLAGTPGISLSAAGQRYLAGGRTPSSNPNLSQEAQAYLAARPMLTVGGGPGGSGSSAGSSSSQVSGSGAAPGSRLLSLTTPNLRGQDVQQVQVALGRWGANLSADGVFGPATQQAVQQFQRSQGLVADGIVGPQTWARLQQSPQPSPPPIAPPLPTSPSTAPSQNRLLRLTNPYTSGQDVRALQQALARSGIALPADGIFGPATERAVRLFQANRGLVTDGVVGPRTWALLQNQATPTPSSQSRVLRLTQPFTTGEDVRAVQRALARSGIGVAADGIFGPGTDRAVKQFQASRGLVADGIVGAQTRSRLGV
jgi:peptidoglycan hydrolase-like protein with peptidoglycan-binding domain/GH24 family phage-related lysozyme (muramidase)